MYEYTTLLISESDSQPHEIPNKITNTLNIHANKGWHVISIVYKKEQKQYLIIMEKNIQEKQLLTD